MSGSYIYFNSYVNLRSISSLNNNESFGVHLIFWNNNNSDVTVPNGYLDNITCPDNTYLKELQIYHI